ncbi:MAG: hypothetical protein M3512_04935 [Bacteroidota bacterium]|nr:hypothetical protein [Bacteroidota bacterium]
MKNKIVFIPILLLIITLLSCDKLDQLLTFDVKDSATFTIPSSTAINLPINIPVPTIQSSASSTFKNNNTNASLVKDVFLKDLTLNLTDPDDMTFRFLKSITIFISAAAEKEVILASITDIPLTTGNTLTLTPSGSKLDVFLKKDSYNIRNVVEIREVPKSSITIRADMVFQVTADPL